MAAGNYVLDSGGSPLPAVWDWAAKSLEFNEPSALIRSMCQGASVPTPAVTEAQKLREARERDKNTTAPPKDTQAIVADGSPLRLGSLISQVQARVCKGEHTRELVPSSSNATPGAASSPRKAHQRPWNAEGQGKRKEKTVLGKHCPLGHRVGLNGVNERFFAAAL